MAILRSADGTFYDIPDNVAEQYKVPPEEVKSKMDAMGAQMPKGGGGGEQHNKGAGMQGSPQIVVQFITKDAVSGPSPSMAQQKPQEETMEAQWWVNWYNWANWYNWY